MTQRRIGVDQIARTGQDTCAVIVTQVGAELGRPAGVENIFADMLVQVQNGAADLEFRGACVVDTIPSMRRVVAEGAVSDCGSRYVG